MKPSLSTIFLGIACFAAAAKLIYNETRRANVNGSSRRAKRQLETDLVPDHRKLSVLLNTMRLNVGFLSGNLKSENVVDDLWCLPKSQSVKKLEEFDFNQFFAELSRLSIIIDAPDFGDERPINLRAIARGINGIDAMKAAEKSLKDDNRILELPKDAISEIKSKHAWNRIQFSAGSALDLLTSVQSLLFDDAQHFFKELMNWETDVEAITEAFQKLKIYSKNVAAAKPKLWNIIKTGWDLSINRTCEDCRLALEEAKVKVMSAKELPTALKNSEVRQKLIWLNQTTTSIISSGSQTVHTVFEEKDEFLIRAFGGRPMFAKLLDSTKPVDNYVRKLQELEKTKTSPTVPSEMQQMKNLFEQARTVHQEYSNLAAAVEQYKCFDEIEIPEYDFEALNDTFHDWLDATTIPEVFTEELDSSFLSSYSKFRKEVKALLEKPKGSVPTKDFEALRRNAGELYENVEKFQKVADFCGSAVPKDMDPIFEKFDRFREWVTKTTFVNPACNLDHLKLLPIANFDDLRQQLLNFQERNPIPILTEKTVKPMKTLQKKLNVLHNTARRMSGSVELIKQFPRNMVEVLRDRDEEIQHVRRGVRQMETLYEWMANRDKIMFVVRNAMETSNLARNITRRGAGKWDVINTFQILHEDEAKIKRFFDQLDHLQQSHQQGGVTLKAIGEIYVKASRISKEFGFNDVNWFRELLLQFDEESFNRSAVLRDVQLNLDQLAHLRMDLSAARSAFRKAFAALEDLDEQINALETMTQKATQAAPVYEEETMFSAMCKVFGYLMLFWTTYYAYKRAKRHLFWRPYQRKKKTFEERVFVPTAQTQQYVRQMLQESRLEINRRDSEGFTPIFRAVQELRVDDVKHLAESGAVLTAVCGKKAQTVLHAAVKLGNHEIVRTLLEHGANQSTKDIDGKRPEAYCTEEGRKNLIPGLLARWHGKRPDRTIPKVKRDFFVLIVYTATFKKEDLARLPERLDVIYGMDFPDVNVENVGLEEITHFVVCSRPGAKDLPLDLDFMNHFEVLAHPGMIVSVEWLHACIKNPAAVDDDYKYLLTDLSFEKKLHKNKLTELKNNIHRLMPPLFYGATLTILPTENEIIVQERDQYIRVIEAFGGYYAEEPYPSHPTEAIYWWKEPNERKPPKLYPSIVLYFRDSIIDERWTDPNNRISLVGAAWLVESIARYDLIRPDHGILRHELDWRTLPLKPREGARYFRRPTNRD